MNDLQRSIDIFLEPYGEFIAQKLNLPHFPPHFQTFLVALTGFTVLHFVSSAVCSRLLPETYGALSRRTRYAWNVHVVSMAHVLIVTPWALYLSTCSIPSLDNDRAFGWSPIIGELHAVSSAYFFWDTLETIYSGSGIAFTLHGAACLFIYGFSYRPFVAYYGARALLWELSTPFLNIHWFLDKAGKTGSTVQLVNGVLLLAMFFFARIIYGWYITVNFYMTLYSVWTEVPISLVLIFGGGNFVLNILNFVWFSKMVNALRKRFPSDKSKAQKHHTNGVSNGHSNGHGDSVMVDGQRLKVPALDGTAESKSA